jgi:iron complex transport system permease protein
MTRWLVPSSIALAIAAAFLAAFLGVADLPPADVLAALKGEGSAQARAIILDIRLPRIATGILVGVHFALAGLILQAITRNPLADPSLMGVSQGAMLAVTIYLLHTVFGPDTGSSLLVEQPVHLLPAIGAAGGVLAGALVYAMAFGRDLGPLRVTLCGIAVGAVLHAIGVGLIAGWGSARIEILLEWMSGSLYARDWNHALFLLPFTFLGLTALAFVRRPLAMLRFDPAVARSFGLAYGFHFSLALTVACVLAASAVGAAGPIVFVGLIVPHLARFAARGNFALTPALTMALGAITVTLGDLAGRVLGGAEEIPLGVVAAICGVPVLVALLRRTA